MAPRSGTGRRGTRGLTVLTLVAALGLTACSGSDPTEPGKAATASRSTATPVSGPSLGLPRAVHRATTLADGRVLFTGGCSEPGCGGVEAAATTALFDPVAAEVAEGPRMREPRISHTATLLPDGRVLVTGGYPGEGAAPTASMEVFDPRAGRFAAFGSMEEPRADHTATLLPDGSVLVVGGRGDDGRALSGVERVDVATGEVLAAPDLPGPRSAHTATWTPDGVLLVGGTGDDDAALAATVRLDPARGAWRPGPGLIRARVKHAAVRLGDGSVLVIGGAADVESRGRFDSTEVLSPGAEGFVPGPALTDGRYKLSDAAVVLADGRVAVAGGNRLILLDLAGPSTTTQLGDLDGRRSFQTLTALAGGRVLAAGGYDDGIRPTAQTWLMTVDH